MTITLIEADCNSLGQKEATLLVCRELNKVRKIYFMELKVSKLTSLVSIVTLSVRIFLILAVIIFVTIISV